jgi:hypothetical protein
MVSTTDTPTNATQRGSRSNGNVALDDKVEQAQRGEHNGRDDHNRRDDNAERRDQGDTSQRSGHDRSDDGQNNRDVSNSRGRDADRHSNDSGHKRGSNGARDNRHTDQERGVAGDRDSNTSDTADVFAPVLGAWKQVFASWVQLADAMVQAQQQAVGQLLDGAGARSMETTDGADRRREPALTAARTSSAPDGQTERNQR